MGRCYWNERERDPSCSLLENGLENRFQNGVLFEMGWTAECDNNPFVCAHPFKWVSESMSKKL